MHRKSAAMATEAAAETRTMDRTSVGKPQAAHSTIAMGAIFGECVQPLIFLTLLLAMFWIVLFASMWIKLAAFALAMFGFSMVHRSMEINDMISAATAARIAKREAPLKAV